ncbi:aminoglycoside phosphotransferase family protein [Sphaerisporangium sp. TRM90804]|uniref:aminoglycoside phosphotransferase family protein n=1 Tax=Sphaerisporangium sp. TRM90804 TaxID=3031113 RepID=UPI002449501B|nr:aminoglycoside phosphotransferase family protein [Sphaerisporangium sp. TRM90804]MDH2430502.1 aminoglycoside phosphotransferase family protein [Sphaerisporangium sp. TRM90804]
MPAGKMHPDELDVDVPLVRRLIAGRFPEWASLPVERIPSAGTVNAMFRLGDDMVVRLPLVTWGADDVLREQRWLPRLGPRLPVAVPVPLGQGAPSGEYPLPWSVYNWLDGENPAPGRVADPHRLAADLAAFITALHRVDPADGPPTSRGAPLATVDAQARAAIEALRGMIDTEAATAAWETALKAPEWDRPPRWLHADLMPGNLLLVGGRLSAVIDFGAVGVGDPACDLMVAWNLLPPPARETFRTAVGLDDATWSRGRGRALAQALIALPYYKDTNPTMAATARHTIAQVLNAPEPVP